jgi:transposase InsO family protein
LRDRSSAPLRVWNLTAAERVEAVVALRRLRMTAAEITELLGMALSTVSGILKRVGMGRLGRIGLEQPVRYEHAQPGELVHIDVKKLGRIEGAAGKRAWGGLRRTLLQGWAYGAIYRSSQERTAALDGWLWHYNHQRRHSALGHDPPVTRTNLLGSYS